MRRRLAAILLLGAAPGFPHRLAEDLQAERLSAQNDHPPTQLRLPPGAAVAPLVLASIDTDGDGRLSGAEQKAYAERVVRDLSLTVDGDPAPLRLVSVKFDPAEELREGLGEIHLELR